MLQSVIYSANRKNNKIAVKISSMLSKYRVKSHQVQFGKRPNNFSNILLLLIKSCFLFVFGTVADPELTSKSALLKICLYFLLEIGLSWVNIEH